MFYMDTEIQESDEELVQEDGSDDSVHENSLGKLINGWGAKVMWIMPCDSYLNMN